MCLEIHCHCCDCCGSLCWGDYDFDLLFQGLSRSQNFSEKISILGQFLFTSSLHTCWFASGGCCCKRKTRIQQLSAEKDFIQNSAKAKTVLLFFRAIGCFIFWMGFILSMTVIDRQTVFNRLGFLTNINVYLGVILTTTMLFFHYYESKTGDMIVKNSRGRNIDNGNPNLVDSIDNSSQFRANLDNLPIGGTAMAKNFESSTGTTSTSVREDKKHLADSMMEEISHDHHVVNISNGGPGEKSSQGNNKKQKSFSTYSLDGNISAYNDNDISSSNTSTIVNIGDLESNDSSTISLDALSKARTRCLAKFIIIFYEIWLIQNFIIFCVYWGILYDPETHKLNASSYFTHILIMIPWTSEILLHRIKWNLWRCFYFFFWGAAYVGWNCAVTFIYDKHVYEILNWREDWVSALIWSFGIMGFGVVLIIAGMIINWCVEKCCYRKD